MASRDGSKKVGAERKRAFAPKSRLGCLTCRKRRIKCDERRPSCDKCLASGFQCDGYQNYGSKPETEKARRSGLVPCKAIAPKRMPTSGTSATPLLFPMLNRIIEPSNSLFGTEKEARYFKLFCDKVAIQLSGVYDLPIWNRFILQAAEHEESVRYAIIAIGALQQSIELRERKDGCYMAPFAAPDEPHQFAVTQYSRAIKQMREVIASQKHNIRTTLLNCLLIICFENMHGNHDSATTQMQIGLHLLEGFIAKRRNNGLNLISNNHTHSNKSILSDATPATTPTLPSFALNSPSPSIIEDDLVHAFARLDMQSNSFTNSRTVEYHMQMMHYGSDCISLMPATFSNVYEANKYYELVVRRLMHWVWLIYHRPKHGPAVKEGLQPCVRNEWTLDLEDGDGDDVISFFQSLAPEDVSPSTCMQKQVHLNELDKWWHAFVPLLNKVSREPKTKEYLCATSLQLRFTAKRFALSTTLNTDQLVYDDRIEDVKQVIRLAKILHDHTPAHGSFTFDLDYLPQLYVMAIKCRDSNTRREAINMLLSKSWREGVWDSIMAGRMASAIMEIEEEGLQDGFIPNEARVRGTKLKSNLQKREGTLTCFMSSGRVVNRKIWW